MKSLLLFAALAVTAAAQNGIFESHADIGAVPKPGALEYDSASNTYRIAGNGANMWAGVDAFHFAWKRLSGDATITADVEFMGSGGDPHRKAVLIFRQSLDPDSPYADVALHGVGLTSLQYRTGKGEPTQQIESTVTGPVRLRLERRGNQFVMSVGKPGEPLVSSAPATVPLQDPVYVGIGVCSHNVDNVETAVFRNVSVQQVPARPAQQRYRSRIKIFDRETRRSSVLFTGDDVWEAPNWSHDGKYLLANSGGSLYRIPVAGGAPEKLDVGAEYRCNNDHGFTFDGKRLAFSASSPSSRVSQVFQATAEGKDVRQMTNATTPSYFHGWSPDGKWLAFVAQREGKFSLFRVAVGGGSEERLTAPKGYDDGPDYSPDGRWIYFNSDRSGGWDIWRIPAAGGGPDDAKAERITSDDLEDWFPHPSPDGKWIVFLSFPAGTANHNGRMAGVQLRLLPTGGKTPRTLTTIFGGQGSINVNSWSPDSKWFAFVEYDPI